MKLNTTHKRQLAIKLKQEKHNKHRNENFTAGKFLQFKYETAEKGMNKTNDWRNTM